MHVLALEPYYGGSHKAFLDGWSANSRHDWTVLSLPANKWKWRMRHAAITFADDVAKRLAGGQSWDLLFCSDMLNLAEFVGLSGPAIGRLPKIAYFHENQLTYPARFPDERDYQFAITNMTTALSADAVWFNSRFHLDSFVSALTELLKRMPKPQPLNAVEQIHRKSSVHWQGVEEFSSTGRRTAGPLRILWAARWEHDKNPQTFFDALGPLKEKGINFKISVIGQQFREVPSVFRWAKEHFEKYIDHWGYQETVEQYRSVLTEADVVVSTADHEFFGISVVEAIAAGAYPLLPKRLAYPEILRLDQEPEMNDFFYDGSVRQLTEKLSSLSEPGKLATLRGITCKHTVPAVKRFLWQHLVPQLDQAMEKLRHKG